MIKDQGWLRMEKISTDYKQPTWKILAKLFRMHKLQFSSDKPQTRLSNNDNIYIHQSAPFSQTMVDVFLQGLLNSVLIFPRRSTIPQHFLVHS